MRKTVIDRLCDEINALNGGCTFPQLGHLRYADIRGDGRNRRYVYAIVNQQGGVVGVHNGATPRETARNLRRIRDALASRNAGPVA